MGRLSTLSTLRRGLYDTQTRHGGFTWIGTYSGHRADGYAFVGDVSGGLGAVGRLLAIVSFDHRNRKRTYPDGRHDRGFGVRRLRRWTCAITTRWHITLGKLRGCAGGHEPPYGVARTSTLYLVPQPSYPGKEGIARTAEIFDADAQLMPLPEYLHEKHAFGIWSLPDSSSADRAKVEKRLSQYISFIRKP